MKEEASNVVIANKKRNVLMLRIKVETFWVSGGVGVGRHQTVMEPKCHIFVSNQAVSESM